LEFTAIHRWSEKLIDREHDAEESDTHREASHGNVPMLTTGVLSMTPNLLPTTVISDAATTG
jgi:hypothetical protein